MRPVKAVALAAMMSVFAWGGAAGAVSASAPPVATWVAPGHYVPPIGGRAPSFNPNGNDYDYVGGYMRASATGASVMLPQSQPRLGANAGHSLIELAVESADGEQIVEVGWVVGEDGGTRPKLFVFHWVDGKAKCYDDCGFVSLRNAIKPGALVARRQTQEYGIKFATGRWWVSYEHKRIGYFPASLWKRRYTRAGLIQVFGEINATTHATCTQMGNGRFGSSHKSDEIRDFRLKGATVPSKVTLSVPTLPKAWNYGTVSNTAFRLGGPGAC